VDGFRRTASAELVGSTLLVLCALAIVLLFGAPAPAAVEAALQRALGRVRALLVADRTAPRMPPRRAFVRALTTAIRRTLPPDAGTAVVDAGAGALVVAMPFGQYLVAAQLDVGVLFVAAATALAGAALVSSGSPSRGLRAALHVAWQHAPAAAAVAGVVVTTGSLRIQEIERAQGGWPWDWLAFRSPATLVALGLLVACVRIEPDVPSGGATRWVAAACRAHRLVVAVLASTLFLGGWLLPGLSPARQDGHPALELAGAAWLMLKAEAIVAGSACARVALPRPVLAERTRATAVLWLPLAAASFGATAAWGWWGPARACQTVVSGALVALLVVAGVALAHRVRYGLAPSGADGHVSSFL